MFGSEWARTHILPHVIDLLGNPHYLYRMTMVKALTLLAGAVGQEVCMRDVMPALKTASRDKVPSEPCTLSPKPQTLKPKP